MNRKFMCAVVGIAVVFIIAVVVMYISTFGTSRSFEHAAWGAFGDYFGGILNPVFALCAFLGVLWSLDMQTKQLKQLSVDKQGAEILVVVKDIDARIGELLGTEVGEVGAEKLFLHHMVSESERGGGVLGSSDSYIQFIITARESGSVIEALTRELRNQVITMYSFLVRYPKSQSDHYAPIVEYYIRKTQRIVPMLNEIEELPKPAIHFFITQQISNEPALAI
ncbi:hypothetical protein [Pectobacterium versatile]|uniref:hypothetical protein n=1 Tax=Pectobacterium versatile TaxID=2488639 RepID=UPI001B39BB40|nr:hypothetical protein [Pectobacterium versatile]MBQ4775622.1 hypothetical protein [Pectobacterium versatile]